MLKRDTILRKKRKPPGACSFAWCSRPPTPGMGTCAICRERRKRYEAKARENQK